MYSQDAYLIIQERYVSWTQTVQRNGQQTTRTRTMLSLSSTYLLHKLDIGEFLVERFLDESTQKRAFDAAQALPVERLKQRLVALTGCACLYCLLHVIQPSSTSRTV
jgi:hypothetical protein